MIGRNVPIRGKPGIEARAHQILRQYNNHASQEGEEERIGRRKADARVTIDNKIKSDELMKTKGSRCKTEVLIDFGKASKIYDDDAQNE